MQSFDVLRSSKWRLYSWTFSFCGRRCFSEVPHPQRYSIATSDTVVPVNIEVPTKYPLSHNDRTVVLEIRLHSESPMLYRPAINGNWNALSLARRALKGKFPTPTIPLTVLLPNRQIFLPDPVLKYARPHPKPVISLLVTCSVEFSSFNTVQKYTLGVISEHKYVRWYFYCYTVHVVDLLNYYTNHCTYIKFTH